jgi:hypothetical protein
VLRSTQADPYMMKCDYIHDRISNQVL